MSLQDDHNDDAVNIAPDLHSVIYEDDKMRVLKVVVPVGAEAEMHWHPHNINYILKSGRLKFTDVQNNSKEVSLEEGQVTSWVEPSRHAVKNTGDSVVETIQVELKY